MKSEEEFFHKLYHLEIPEKFKKLTIDFVDAYKASTKNFSDSLPCLFQYLNFLEIQIKQPHVFEHFHKKIRHPLDYYQFGLDFIRPLVDFENSSILGYENLQKISSALSHGENVILLANHQTESDPQAISVMLTKQFPILAESIIYIAGERVLTDPLAVPFSLGCDLLCIYSKRYIDHPLEKKAQKQQHNKKTMMHLSKLLHEGGKIIYVAPSGGRDRKNSSGEIVLAPFDPDSIEMLYLMSKIAKTPTHFYPFALKTYDLLPPPDGIQQELGEKRNTQRAPVHLGFAESFNMDEFPGCSPINKSEHRSARAIAIWKEVQKIYCQF